MRDIKKETASNSRFSSGVVYWSVVSILTVLFLCSVILLSARLHAYAKLDEYAVALKSNMDAELDIFSITYKNASGEITVEGTDGEKIIAPGTQVEYTVRLRNKDKIAIDYDLISAVEIPYDHVLPVLVRMMDLDGNYLAGDAKTWVPLDALCNVHDTGTIGKSQSTEYIFQWKWAFESGDDGYDTLLGDNTLTEDIGVSLSFTVHAEANTAMEDNGGFYASGTHNIMLPAIFLILLLCAIVLLMVYRFKHRAAGRTHPES